MHSRPNRLLVSAIAATAAMATAMPMLAAAAVSESEAARLGQDLTPMGAEKSGDPALGIPAWTGGLTDVHPDFKPTGHYPNPYSDDELQFEITGDNADQYAKHLTPGQIKLLKQYPTWKMKVYPSRRSASFPQGIYDATRENATQVTLVEGGNGFTGSTAGIAFPIPQNGTEVIWNHLTAYKGNTWATSWAQAPVTSNGDYNLVEFDYEYDFIHGNQLKDPSERKDNLLLYFLQAITAPPRLAGSILLVHEYADQVSQPRKAWIYNPGSRRVRLAPNVAYDNPGTASDSLRTNDDFGMFNGATDRYDWEIIGKKAIYIPYNTFDLNSDKISTKDVLMPGHINPEHARYELHRVWHVRATLRDGTSHIYKRRDFYLDEDSWVVHVVDKYDNRDQLWRVSEMHSLNFYDLPMLSAGVEVHHDLNAKRYIAMRLTNDNDVVYQPIKANDNDFRPAALRSRGRR
ncbi:MAG: DUF1329 domain-containing protein [Abyssibacter sp.]|jgi:hypothetical protein|nr:DUF1329 domain-containing protein [Abyssibacter sp.]MBB88253.1 outer membrane lipoprotein-sorting protein [Xanthomonadales bacterium]MCK5858311.1 DUF1329 domain-containing protein [Abyssibacter sp.]